MRRPGSSGPTGGPTSSLTSRLIVAMIVVATVAFLFAALLTAPLVRSSAQHSARVTLARQADLLAQLPRGARLTQRADNRADVRGLYLGVVTPRGMTTGAAQALDAEQLARLRAGRPVSASGALGGQRVLIEARPVTTGNGGAVVLATSASDVDQAIATQRHRLLLALALGLAVALAAGIALAGYLGRPLVRLAASARRMGAGERSVGLPESGTREVADLADSLHHLDRALQSSEERQRRFLLSVSHELRTPLTSIRGNAESLVDGAVPPEELAGVGETMVRESLRLESYVQDLLALARLDAEDFDVRSAPMDARAAVQETVAAWQERCAGAGLNLRAEVPAAPIPVDSDQQRLRQVLDVLVDNAVRVCPAGAAIVIAAASDPGSSEARLEVRDSGPGLTEEDAAVAFQPGVLHDRYAGERPGGHGLGLAIAERLVTRLGGRIEVERAAEGGAGFVIRLPSRMGSPEDRAGRQHP